MAALERDHSRSTATNWPPSSPSRSWPTWVAFLRAQGYLQALRELTQEYGALLILDEVVTGFRYAPGGCQQYYGIKPDISTFGKALGAGFPVGAVAGPRSILERMRWSENMVSALRHLQRPPPDHESGCRESRPALRRRRSTANFTRSADAAIAGLREVFRRRNNRWRSCKASGRCSRFTSPTGCNP